jgi:drug/metabolite transporter (DMT)-like permease
VGTRLRFRGERVLGPFPVGAVCVAGGGGLLAGERDRPEAFRRIGLVYAAAAAVLFATRDNLVRALHGHATPETAAAATLLAGAVVAALWTRRAPTRSELGRFAPAGVLFGLSYLCLFAAYYRGRVTVVSPLVATESLWGVAFSALLIGKAEHVGPRLVAGAALIVAGGVLIGAVH